MDLNDNDMEELLKGLPQDVGEKFSEMFRKARDYTRLIDEAHAEHVLAVVEGETTGVVFSPKEIPEETKEQMRVDCPFPLRFVVGIKPCLVQKLLSETEAAGLSTAIGVMKEDPRDFLVSVATPEGEEPEGFREKLIEFIGKVFRADEYPTNWTIIVNNEEVFNLKQSTFSDEEVEALRQKLESAQDVNDIINSL